MSNKSLNLYELAQLYLQMEPEEVDSLSIEQKEGLIDQNHASPCL